MSPVEPIQDGSSNTKLYQNELSNDECVILKCLRLMLNLVTNILIILTVFICLLYAFSSTEIGVFQLHVILCVLGYQLCMCQGTLVLSKYNSWSTHLHRRHKQHLHWILQLMGFILAAVGSILMICAENNNFSTSHGITGLCALIASVIGLLNGILAMYAYKLRNYIHVYWIKLVHYLTGIGTLFLSSTCLSLGFDKAAFKGWSGSADSTSLITITCLFTILVSIGLLDHHF